MNIFNNTKKIIRRLCYAGVVILTLAMLGCQERSVVEIIYVPRSPLPGAGGLDQQSIFKPLNKEQLRYSIENLIGRNADLTLYNQVDYTNVGDVSYLFRNIEFTGFFKEDLIEWITNWETANMENMEGIFSESDFNGDLSGWDTSNVKNMSKMFYNNTTFNQPIGNWNTSNVTDMSAMFQGADLFNQDLNNWDTSQVTDMSSMFQDTGEFNGNINDWNTSGVTSMANMFRGGREFNQPISNWNTSGVTTMYAMFYEADQFNQDLNWDTSQVVNMESLFQGAADFNGNITNWDTGRVTTMKSLFQDAVDFNQPIGDWDTSSVTTMEGMFYNTSGSTSEFNQPIGDWDTSKVTSMYAMFYGADQFNQDLTNWNTSQVVNMESLFQNAASFNGNITNWDTSQVTTMKRLFRGAGKFDQPIGGWNTENVTIMESMFFDAGEFDQPVGNWKTGQVTSMYAMFYGASLFNQPINIWNTGNVTTMSWMFGGATSFNRDLNGWNTSKVTSMYAMFYGASLFNQDLNGWDTGNVKSMARVFQGASVFNGSISNWNTSQVTTMGSMFENAVKYNQPISNWDVSQVTDMSWMFYQAKAFGQDISGWNTSKVTDMARIFYEADNFNQDISGWNTSRVTDMSYMFYSASTFDRPIGNWDIRQVTSMREMFRDASAFNQDLSDWKIKRKVEVFKMFQGSAMRNRTDWQPQIIVYGIALKLGGADAGSTITKATGDSPFTLTVAVAGSPTNVSWSSADTGVAAVAAGQVTINGAGTALITVTSTEDTSISDSVVLKVISPVVTRVALRLGGNDPGPTLSKNVGDPTFSLSAEVSTIGSVLTNVAWSSTNAGAASVSADGQVTIKAAGTTLITATSTEDTSISDSIVLEVIDATGISFEENGILKPSITSSTIVPARGSANFNLPPIKPDGATVTYSIVTNKDGGNVTMDTNTGGLTISPGMMGVGVYTITVTGTGSYTGKIKQTVRVRRKYVISPADLGLTGKWTDQLDPEPERGVPNIRANGGVTVPINSLANSDAAYLPLNNSLAFTHTEAVKTLGLVDIDYGLEDLNIYKAKSDIVVGSAAGDATFIIILHENQIPDDSSIDYEVTLKGYKATDNIFTAKNSADYNGFSVITATGKDGESTFKQRTYGIQTSATDKTLGTFKIEDGRYLSIAIVAIRHSDTIFRQIEIIPQ